MTSINIHDLRLLAEPLGLSLLGVTEAIKLSDEARRLHAWQKAGFAGEMAYMERDADLLSTPQRLFDELKSIVVFGVHHDRSEKVALMPGYGRVARYAWGRDYHKVLRKNLERFVEAVSTHLSMTIKHRVFSDSVPLLERALARSAGLGFVGKNTMVIAPGSGSYMFLGEVLWDLEITGVEPREPILSTIEKRERCGGCSNCLDACPTNAFVSERVLDARRCISYLTIEKRGELTWQEREWIGEWVFGCDICQDVCPFNYTVLKKRAKPALSEFEASHGAGQALNLEEVLSIKSDQEFIERFGGTPITRTKREGLLRNAAVVAANTKNTALRKILHHVSRSDSSAIVRQHALWSYCHLCRLEGGLALKQSSNLLELLASDSDPIVQREVKSLRAIG